MNLKETQCAVMSVSGQWREGMIRVDVIELRTLPAILTIEEVGHALRVSRNKAYELAHQKGFPAVRFGRTIRVPRDALIQWLETQAIQ